MFTVRRQVCKCGCFNRGNVISSERDDRLGSLEVSAVAVMGNLRSTVRLRTSRTDRVGDRGTPEVEGQVKGSVEFSTGRVWTLTICVHGDVPTPKSAIEECVEVVQITPQERISECIAEQENRRL